MANRVTKPSADRTHSNRVGVSKPSVWGDAAFLDASRVVLIGTIWAATWMIGGFYHLPRFLTLSLLAVAVLLAWLDLRHIISVFRATRGLWVISGLLLALGAFQLTPLPASLASIVSGSWTLRREYAGIDESSWSMISLVPWETFTWMAFALVGISGLFLGAGLFRSPKAKLLLLGSIAACGATQVFWGIVQTVTHPNEIFWGMSNEGGTTPFGTFLVRNHGADFVGMSLLCSIGLLHYSLKKSEGGGFSYGTASTWQRTLFQPNVLATGALTIWLVVGLACTNSRGGWTSFLITMIAIVLTWQHSRQSLRLGRAIGFVVIAVIGMLVIQSVGLLDRFEDRVGDLEVDRVLADGRWQLWKDSIPALLHFLPMGSGLGTYGYAILPFEPTPANGWLPNAHNQYIETLVEAGIPGLLLVLGFIWIAGRASLSLCRSDRTFEKQALGIAGFGTLLFQSLHAMTEFGLLMPANLLTASVLIGAAVAAAPTNKKSVASRHNEPAIALAARSQRWSALGCSLLVLLLGAFLAAAIWHQARCVRAQRLLAETLFAPSTPSPTVATAAQWIADIQGELLRSPQNEVLRRRLIQLHMHRAQRATYDQIRAGQVAQARPSNPIADWDRTSLESIIMQLYADGDDAPTPLEKQRISSTVAKEPSLVAAWSEFRLSLAANPIQPKTHMRMAQLAAASGRPWDDHFKHSMRLSAVDPRQSLGNGLLAWAANDTAAMTQQWRQTLSVDLTQLELIYRLSRLKLTDQAIVEHLMPNRWVVPYRLALIIKGRPGTETLCQSLLELASMQANANPSDELSRLKALASIAHASGDFATAAEQFKQAIQTDLKDPELRYLLAYSLYRCGKADQAATHARVAVNLAPSNEKYKKLFEQSKQLHHRQTTTD